jgi:hypothetical protein
MRDLGLADRIRAKGVRVVEVAGWQTRGNSSGFQPRGAVHHHTAGSSRGATPSLNINIYGRSDVPGPLCQVMQSREPDFLDKAYVISSGKANHGGVGHWNNPATGELMNSNYESEGLEVEHTGTGPVSPVRHEISARILAAFLEAPGSSRDWRMCCQHYEYADPPGRKIDFFDLNPPFANRADGIRQRVGYWIGRTATEEDDMDTEEFRRELQAGLHKFADTRLDETAGALTWSEALGKYTNNGIPYIQGRLKALEDHLDAIEAKIDALG